MPNGYEHKRSDDPPDCYRRHSRWIEAWWKENGMPKVKLLILLTLIGTAGGAVTVSGLIARAQVNQMVPPMVENEVSKSEDHLEQKIGMHSTEMHEIKKDLTEDIHRVEKKVNTLGEDIKDILKILREGHDH